MYIFYGHMTLVVPYMCARLSLTKQIIIELYVVGQDLKF
jgi:hypothetical protein